MSDHPADAPPKATLPNWVLSVAGVLGSFIVIVVVLAVAYNTASPKQSVDADAAAERKRKLSEVQAAESNLYSSYSVLDAAKKIVRIPVSVAVDLEAAKLAQETRDKPAAPERLSLAASPAGMVPVPPPMAAAPATTATPAAAAPAGAAKAAGPATPLATPAAPVRGG